MTDIETQLLGLALAWRTGADELRRQFLAPGGVPQAAEAAAATMEHCADRLEQLIGNESD